MAETKQKSLNELFFEATGATMDLELYLQNLPKEAHLDAIKRILFMTPGGAANIGAEFIERLSALNIDVDGDGKVDDVIKLDLDADGDTDPDDVEVFEAIESAITSSAEIVETPSEAPTDAPTEETVVE